LDGNGHLDQSELHSALTEAGELASLAAKFVVLTLPS